jgi:pimeloyl-ACP methyl ester carboxylesterase
MRVLLLLMLTALPQTGRAVAVDSGEFCEFQMAPSTDLAREIYADFMRLPNGVELFVKVEKPAGRKPKGWFFLVHGLLGSHRSYDTLAKRLLRNGYGVARMDLEGFARSLQRRMDNDYYFQAPDFFRYGSHVADLKLLLKELKNRFGISRPQVVGHSMGGGLALALLADPEGAALAGEHATVIAPYIYRLDYYLAEKYAYMGWAPPFLLTSLDGLVPNIVRMAPEFLFDTFISDPQMYALLSDYFNRVIVTRELNISRWKLSRVRNRHVNSAMASIKGLRDFNAYNALDKIPAGTRVDLFYGDADPLVERRWAFRLGRLINSRGGRVTEFEAGHELLDEVPDQLAESLTRP